MSDRFKTGPGCGAETAGMGTDTLTPALGRFAPTRFYDRVVALTRERLWRSLTAMYVAPRPGDVIVGMNGQQIDDASQFLRLVADSKPGTTAVLKVLRAGRTMEFKLPIVSTSTTRTRG